MFLRLHQYTTNRRNTSKSPVTNFNCVGCFTILVIACIYISGKQIDAKAVSSFANKGQSPGNLNQHVLDIILNMIKKEQGRLNQPQGLQTGRRNSYSHTNPYGYLDVYKLAKRPSGNEQTLNEANKRIAKASDEELLAYLTGGMDTDADLMSMLQNEKLGSNSGMFTRTF